jgi:hypothetical protein
MRKAFAVFSAKAFFIYLIYTLVFVGDVNIHCFAQNGVGIEVPQRLEAETPAPAFTGVEDRTPPVDTQPVVSLVADDRSVNDMTGSCLPFFDKMADAGNEKTGSDDCKNKAYQNENDLMSNGNQIQQAKACKKKDNADRQKDTKSGHSKHAPFSQAGS